MEYNGGTTTSTGALWLRDAPGHTGADLWGGEYGNSPDLWIRHADDGGTNHQAPIAGRDNWFYARVWEHANLAQKNLTVVELQPGAWVILPVVIGPAIDLEAAALEVWRDSEGPLPRAALVHKSPEFFPRRRVRPLPPAVRPPEPDSREEPQRMDYGGREQPPKRAGVIPSPHDPERVACRFPEGVELPLKDVPRARVRIRPPGGGHLGGRPQGDRAGGPGQVPGPPGSARRQADRRGRGARGARRLTSPAWPDGHERRLRTAGGEGPHDRVRPNEVGERATEVDVIERAHAGIDARV
jgi:hypothetical protein